MVMGAAYLILASILGIHLFVVDYSNTTWLGIGNRSSGLLVHHQSLGAV
jgi:hypothetical protein